jgi:hypothetical protein
MSTIRLPNYGAIPFPPIGMDFDRFIINSTAHYAPNGELTCVQPQANGESWIWNPKDNTWTIENPPPSPWTIW